MSAFVNLFAELDRLGPGSAESLRWVLNLANISPSGCILDAGCGTGADLGVLGSAVPKGRVIALDVTKEFIARAKARYPKIHAHVGDLLHPPSGPFDLIWSAGALYNVGVTQALTAWKAQLTENGCVAFSDLRARVPNPPAEVTEFWASEGVVLRDAASLQTEVEDAGYSVLGTRWVGPAGWASYYGPLEAELDGLVADQELAAHLRAEIALWRVHGVTYGYRIVVAKPL